MRGDPGSKRRGGEIQTRRLRSKEGYWWSWEEVKGGRAKEHVYVVKGGVETVVQVWSLKDIMSTV